ncbi:MAG: ABC transporter substrate-binding protein [Gaiellaceae bacterium]
MRQLVSVGPSRRRLTLLFALLLTLGVIVAACGGDDSAAPAEEPAAEPAAEEPAAEEPAAEEPAAEEPAAEEPAAEPPAEAASGEPLIIGRPIALSGFINFYDGPIGIASEVAAAEINAAGGILGRPVEFVDFDNGSDPAASGAAAQEAIEAGAEIIIPTCDFDIAQGAARTAHDNGILTIHCAGGELSGFSGLGALHFNVFPGGTSEGSSNAYHALERGWTNAYLLEDQLLDYTKDHCRFFEEAFVAGGGTIVGKDTFQNDDPSFASQIAAMQAAEPDVVAVCSVLPGGAAMMNQIRDVSDVPIETGIAFDGEFWLEAVGDISDVFIATVGSIAGDETDATRAAYYEAYEAYAGEPAPHALSLEGYQIMYLLAEAIEAAGTTEGAAVGKALEDNDFTVLGETFDFTPTCHRVSRPLTIVQLQNGVLSRDGTPEIPEFPPSDC